MSAPTRTTKPRIRSLRETVGLKARPRQRLAECHGLLGLIIFNDI